MCNLYRMNRAVAEVAKLFRVDADPGANFGSEVYPGYPGLVVAEGRARTMAWGFPLVLKSKVTGEPLKPKPVNNARTDKLDTNFWKSAFEKRRCLIPVSAWAEAQGPKGKMTRTWLSLPDEDVFAIGGVWRPTDEWGDAYSMVMTDAAIDIADVHDRMPVILGRESWSTWLEGAAGDARDLCVPWDGKIETDRTSVPWVKRKTA